MDESAAEIERRGCRQLLMALGLVGVLWLLSPPFTLHPTCTYTSLAESNATIEVDGRRYTASIRTERSTSRDWIASMNYEGCKQKYGTLLPFKLQDGRVVLLDSLICSKAEEKIRSWSNVDVKEICHSGKGSQVYIDNFYGYVIDNYKNPRSWYYFRVYDRDSPVRLISWNAQPTVLWPHDDIKEIAPAILRTEFAGGDWWRSPNRGLMKRLLGRETEFTASFEEQPLEVIYEDNSVDH